VAVALLGADEPFAAPCAASANGDAAINAMASTSGLRVIRM
jgi:hypothetical protein